MSSRLCQISFAIVFVLSTSTVSGFIIRELDTWDATTDLDTAGSDLLEVWSDLKTINATQVNENVSDEVIALNSLRNTSNKIITKIIPNPIIINIDKEVNKTDSNVILELREHINSVPSTESTSEVYFETIGYTSLSDTINRNWDVKNDPNKLKKILNINDLQNTTAVKSYAKSEGNMKKFNSNRSRASLTEGDDNVTTALFIHGLNNYQDLASTEPFANNINDVFLELATNSTESTTNNIDVETSTILDDHTGSSDDCTDIESSSAVLTEDVILDSSDITTAKPFSKNMETTTESQSLQTFITKTDTGATTSTFPPWKHYKTINRRTTTSTTPVTEDTTTSASEIMVTESIIKFLENPLENTSIPSENTQEQTYLNYEMMNVTINGPREFESTTSRPVEEDLQTISLNTLVSNMAFKTLNMDKLISNLHTRQSTLNIETTKLTDSLDNDNIQTSTLDTRSANLGDSNLDTVLENFVTQTSNWDATMASLDKQLSTFDSQPQNVNTETPLLDTTLDKFNTQTSTSDIATANSDISNLDTIMTSLNAATLDSKTSNLYTSTANLDTERSTLNSVSGNSDTQTKKWNVLMPKFDNKMANLHEHLNKQASNLDGLPEKSKTIAVNTNTEESIFNTNTSKLNIQSTEKLDVVSSKRAGYLDNTETTTLKPEYGTTAIITNKKQDIKDTFVAMYGSEDSYGELNESPGNKTLKNTKSESQSQLAEDAIKEEFLIEKILNDHSMLAPEQSPSTDDNSSSVRNNMFNGTVNGSEKRNISTLYTVSPNYKPAKKLDVQPLKQFVRDPDDNSWRNESINSLGIVFKPKNASKSFTEVLKNKTTELNSITKRDNKTNVPVLRFRLEKMTELRKSKKKKNDAGGGFYTDYDEMAGDVITSFNEEPSVTTSSTTKYDSSKKDILTPKVNIFDLHKEDPTATTQKLKKNPAGDYFDPPDEYEADYAIIPKIELKKFKSKDNVANRPSGYYTTHSMDAPTTPLSTYPPNRQATVQYFPPTKKSTQKVVMNQYDDGFQIRLKQFTYREPTSPIRSTTPSVKPQVKPITQSYKPDKTVSLINHQTESNTDNFGNINRASYIIRHYKDFINNAAKDSDDDRSGYMPYTEAPTQRDTISDLAKLFTLEYEAHPQRGIMDRFVENFNRNSEKFKVDFPILYNTSVVHRKEDDNGRVLASSAAIYKRLYEPANPRSSVIVTANPCTSNCDNLNIDLSPAYELHYYVPEQEEKEEINPHQAVDTQLNRYRL